MFGGGPAPTALAVDELFLKLRTMNFRLCHVMLRADRGFCQRLQPILGQ